jgi:glycogen operon protein
MQAERRSDRGALMRLLRQLGLPAQEADADGPLTPALVEAVHALIAATPAMLALVQADDLAGEVTAVNLPGTDHERPNWRRRLMPDLASLLNGADPVWRAFRERRNAADT